MVDRNCKTCGEIFNTFSSQKLYCSPVCRKVQTRKITVKAVSNRRRKLKILAIEYKGGCCQLCGYTRSVTALEFHHLDPEEKDFSLSVTGTTKSWESIKIELDKCVLLCANCHREVHAGLVVPIALPLS